MGDSRFFLPIALRLMQWSLKNENSEELELIVDSLDGTCFSVELFVEKEFNIAILVAVDELSIVSVVLTLLLTLFVMAVEVCEFDKCSGEKEFSDAAVAEEEEEESVVLEEVTVVKVVVLNDELVEVVVVVNVLVEVAV